MNPVKNNTLVNNKHSYTQSLQNFLGTKMCKEQNWDPDELLVPTQQRKRRHQATSSSVNKRMRITWENCRGLDYIPLIDLDEEDGGEQ